jgi:hypothetical protein
MSGTETLTGANLDYECCKSRGAIASLDANTGKVLWRVQSVPEPLRKLGESSHGKEVFGPAGASVWNTPTIDAKRKLVYVGTGNSFGRLAADTSDSILALRMEDGKMMWPHRGFLHELRFRRLLRHPADRKRQRHPSRGREGRRRHRSRSPIPMRKANSVAYSAMRGAGSARIRSRRLGRQSRRTSCLLSLQQGAG